MTNFDPTNLAERYAKCGEDWCDKKAAADLLLRANKGLYAKIALEKFPTAGSAAKAELMADASEEYLEHGRLTVEAQKKENLAWIHFEQIKVFIELTRSREASDRALVNLR